LISENVLVDANGPFIKLLIRKQKNSILLSVILASHYGTSARKANMMISLGDGK